MARNPTLTFGGAESLRRLVVTSTLLVPTSCVSPSHVESAVGTSFQDCANCPAMVVIRAGSFVMGSPQGEAETEGAPEEAVADERPRRTVHVGTFALSRTEVTREQFAEFVAQTGYEPSGPCHTLGEDDRPPSISWRDPGFAQDDQHPVVCVNWHDAQAYAAWLAATLHQPYRLPTEVEWEYAARSGAGSARPWTSLVDAVACRHANVADASAAAALGWRATNELIFQCDDGFAQTSPVASFGQNAFGLSDMLGNVWEWVEDCYHDTYANAPPGQTAWVEADCAERVDRGGSWNDVVWIVRSANRGNEDPNVATTNLGIRVARDVR